MEKNNNEEETKNIKEEKNEDKKVTRNPDTQNQEMKQLKKRFFKKLWYSITKIEKYGEMAAEGVPRALSYLLKLTLIIAIVFGLGTVYQTNKVIKDTSNIINEKVENFNYKDGILETGNQEEIIIESTDFGKIIINTKTEDTEKINNYINSFNNETGIILLKDKMVITGVSASTVTYNYQDILKSLQITEFSKQSVIDTINGNQMFTFYISLFLTMLIYAVAMYLMSILWNTVILSIFGYIATWFARIKMRYAAIFNMSVYAISLSVLLNTVYIAINIFTNFEIKYFQVMYIAVAAIYLIAAIFIIKSEFIKKQIELTKIVEIQKQIKEKMEEDKQEKEEKKEKTPKDKEDKKEEKKKKQEKDGGEEPEGSEA